MTMRRFPAYLLVVFALTSAPLLLARQADQDATKWHGAVAPCGQRSAAAIP